MQNIFPVQCKISNGWILVVSIPLFANLMDNHSLTKYRTDYLVAHTSYTRLDGIDHTSYRLHHTVVPSSDANDPA